MMKGGRKISLMRLLALCLVLGVGCFTTACKISTVGENAEIEPAISEQTAIQSSADLIKDVYEVTIDTGRMQAEDLDEAWCTVYANHTDDGRYDYYTMVDTQTGEIMRVSMNDGNLAFTDEQREAAIAFDLLNGPGSDVQKVVDACTPIAQELVERVFADGRTVTQTQFASIINDSEVNAVQFVSISIRMDEGACYAVTVAWPQTEVFSVSVYPLGWHSCIYGYYDPAEADEYEPLED